MYERWRAAAIYSTHAASGGYKINIHLLKVVSLYQERKIQVGKFRKRLIFVKFEAHDSGLKKLRVKLCGIYSTTLACKRKQE